MSSKLFPVSRNPKAVVLAAAFCLVTVGTAGAEKVEPYEGKVTDVRISVRSWPEKEEYLMLELGQTLKLKPGQRVLLRPFTPRDGNPTGQRQYLSAEFSLDRQSREILDWVESDRYQGKVVLHAFRRSAGKRATVSYRLVGKIEATRAGLVENTIPIEIEDAEIEDAPPVVTPPPKPRLGVTLYEDSHYRGDSETLYEDTPDLRSSRIRNDRASSIRVPEGCTVLLYRDTDYQGKLAVLRSDTPELGDTPVGNDAVSSLKIDCESANADPPRPEERPGSGRRSKG